MGYEEDIALYKAHGINIKEDWAGSFIVEGDIPACCPICGQKLIEYERLDSGDAFIEILKGCPDVDHVAVWETGDGYPVT